MTGILYFLNIEYLYKKKLIRLSEQHRLNNQIIFIDNCKNMPLAYKISDIIVSASIEPEAFGRVSVEAQSMEKPIIASNIGGSKETIIDDKTGFLFEAGDVNSLSKKIIQAIKVKKEDGKKETVRYVDGQVRLGGIGAYIGDQIYRITNAETRVTVLGHVQRGAQPTHRDRLIASAFGVYAVDLIAQEKFNRVVVWKDRGVQDVSLDNVAGYSKTISRKDPLINVARGLGIYIGEID